VGERQQSYQCGCHIHRSERCQRPEGSGITWRACKGLSNVLHPGLSPKIFSVLLFV
jgi:hypothetical protein